MTTPDVTARANPKGAVLGAIAQSAPMTIVLTLMIYAVYATVYAVSLIPSIWLLLSAGPRVLELRLSSSILAASTLGAAVIAGCLYAYLFWGVFVQATLVRLLSLGIKAGRYPAVSMTTLRWLIYSGIYTITMRTILPLIPVSFLTNAYFRIIGCTMGRNVKLNSYTVNDAYLLTIGNDVIVGGQTDISCHLFEHDHLILRPISIGDGTLIGAHSYIAPGVTIGRKCVIGLYSYIRAGHVVPDGAVVTSLAGIDVHTARALERGRLHTTRTASDQAK